jgi:hypothetical protein
MSMIRLHFGQSAGVARSIGLLKGQAGICYIADLVRELLSATDHAAHVPRGTHINLIPVDFAPESNRKTSAKPPIRSRSAVSRGTP